MEIPNRLDRAWSADYLQGRRAANTWPCRAGAGRDWSSPLLARMPPSNKGSAPGPCLPCPNEEEQCNPCPESCSPCVWCCWLCRPPTKPRSEGRFRAEASHPRKRLLTGTVESRDWLMYGGNYDNTRFSPADRYRPQQRQKNSVPAWVFQTGIPYQFQAAPIVADGMMYVLGRLQPRVRA